MKLLKLHRFFLFNYYFLNNRKNDPNLNPITTLELNRKSINSYLGISNSEKKLSLGGMIGA